MKSFFDQDLFPDKPKILFIGAGYSSHAHSWINLLQNTEINVRFFAMPGTQPPHDWAVKTYVSRINGEDNAQRVYLCNEPDSLIKTVYYRIRAKIGVPLQTPDEWLAEIIRKWKPDVIQTLGLFDDQGGLFYLRARQKYSLESYGKWVLQLRGGSDMMLRHLNPEFQETLKEALTECDQIITDNYRNIEYASEMGIPREKFASFVPVPGSGGIDLTNDPLTEYSLPSKRERILLWPKAYELKWAKGVPILNAIQSAWEKIRPCEIYMLAISLELKEWYFTLPEEIKEHCHLLELLPRKEVLSLMKRSRVMLAPSLIDGVPNSLYEAMAYGAFPIISPLESITPIVKQEDNVLFARNLYPDEIAAALIRAMNDDDLIDNAAIHNYELVNKLVNRKNIGQKVVEYYKTISTME